MTAPDLTAEQANKLAEFEATAPAPESIRERVAAAIHAVDEIGNNPVRTWDGEVEGNREDYRKLADAAIDVLRGPATEADKALARVLVLADEWDRNHADWCCTKGCVQDGGRHVTPGALDGLPFGMVPVPLPTVPCPRECTCDVGIYLRDLRAAIRGDS